VSRYHVRDMSEPARSIRDNLRALRARIGDLARAAGRRPEEVRLIAASKTRPLAIIEAAAAAGQTDFGESTIQDALAKIPSLAGRGLTWHFIGHLQSNKAKFLPGHFHWLHSLDSASLAARVSRRAHEKGTVIESLIEVNIARDPKKHGVAPDALPALIEEILKQELPGIRLRGLMGMAPYPAPEADIRTAFAALRQLRAECAQRFGLGSFDELSMGMSGDYAEAIREGSTMLRIGTAIFGERDYATPA
jgi:pyridoxal phosphate enzyme (YggS family)